MPHSHSRRRSGLREFQLIDTLRRRHGRTGPQVVRGIGDDAAVVTPLKGYEWVVTTDLMAEGVHFDPTTAAFEDIGYKAAVANLSDIAAMGGKPDYLLVSLASPASRTASEIKRLYRGIMRACRPYGVQLIGGDTSASLHGLFVNIMLIGSVPIGRALTRDGARVGDLIYVTGTLGDSLAGLNLLSRRRSARASGAHAAGGSAASLIRRHLRPTPRIEIGQTLSAQRLATSAIDLSDGLSGDLRHLCAQSRVGADIEADALPISSALRRYAQGRRLDPIQLALTGGEDYELLFTIAPRHCLAVERLAGKMACTLSRIGIVRPLPSGVRLNDRSGRLRRMPMLSYRHFNPAPNLSREGR